MVLVPRTGGQGNLVLPVLLVVVAMNVVDVTGIDTIIIVNAIAVVAVEERGSGSPEVKERMTCVTITNRKPLLIYAT